MYTPQHTPYDIKANYGFFHVYAFTMTLGFVLAICFSFFKAYRKKVPYEPIIVCLLFVIPLSLLFGSFFGKLEDPDFNGIDKFAFWQGGMSIHGGVIGGAIAGDLGLLVLARRYNISMATYFDIILPNVLLGQIVGRWGNFFNHELLGRPTTLHALRWLPPFLRENCFEWQSGHPEMNGNGGIQYRQPLFLYESFLNFILFCLITFLVPNFGKWFGPRRRGNHMISTCGRCQPPAIICPICSGNHTISTCVRCQQQKPISKKELWRKYFWSHQLSLRTIGKVTQENKNIFGCVNNLDRLYNPANLWVTMVGVETSCYILGYNGIRVGLETLRTPEQYFIQYQPFWDFFVIGSFALFGLACFFFFQFCGPKWFRKVGYMYEKKYVNFFTFATWNWSTLFQPQNHQQDNKTYQAVANDFIARKVGLSNQENPQSFLQTRFDYSDQELVGSRLLIKFSATPTPKMLKAFPGFTLQKKEIILLDYRVTLNKILKKLLPPALERLVLLVWNQNHTFNWHRSNKWSHERKPELSFGQHNQQPLISLACYLTVICDHFWNQQHHLPRLQQAWRQAQFRWSTYLDEKKITINHAQKTVSLFTIKNNTWFFTTNTVKIPIRDKILNQSR